MTWPSAKPMKYTETVNDMRDTATPRSAAISVNAGKYKSIVNGVSAFNTPSDKIRKKV